MVTSLIEKELKINRRPRFHQLLLPTGDGGATRPLPRDGGATIQTSAVKNITYFITKTQL